MSAPYVANVLPSSGSSIDETDVVSFGVFCDVDIAQMAIAVSYDAMQTAEFVWSGSVVGGTVTGTYLFLYGPTSSVIAASDLGNAGGTFTLLRSPVWPTSFAVYIAATSSGGDVLTTTLTWDVVNAQPVPVPAPILPDYPVGPGPGPNDCDAVEHDQAYYLALFDRTFPDFSYLAPLKSSTIGGYELFQGSAQVGARLSTATANLECGALIIFAPEGAYATGFVTFYREDTSHGNVTIKLGSVVTTSQGGNDFATTEDVLLTGLSVTAPVIAIAKGYEWNVKGEVITPRGEVLPGEIDTTKTLVLDPAYGDPTIQVQQLIDTAGGVPPYLEGLGDDRGLPRAPGEEASAYRLRIRSLADTVSPGAIIRAAHRVLDPLSIDFDFIETGDIQYQTCWDAPSLNVGTPTYQPVPPLNPNFDTNLFVYDDPRSEYPFRNRWLDEREMRGAFIIVIKQDHPILDTGMAFDDPGSVPSDFIDSATGWRRGTSSWDIPFPADTSVLAYGAYDGDDVGTSSAFIALWDTLQKIKAGGVAAIIELWHPT